MIRKLTKRHWSLIVLFILLILIFYFILPVSIPIITAFITAIILNPLVRLIQKRTKLNRKLSVIIVFLLFGIVTGFTGTIIVTKAIAQVVNFVEDVPAHVNQLAIIFTKWESDFQQYTASLPPEFFRQVTNSLEQNFNDLATTIKQVITLDNIAQIIAKIPQYLISFLVYLIALFLFMLELPILKSKVYHLFTEETAKKVSFMNARLSNVVLGFLKAQFLVSIIIFIVSLVALLFIVPEVAIIMAIIIWLIDLIPIIGSIIILAPWAGFVFLTGNTSMAVQLSILAIVLLAIRRIIEPKLMGQHIGLSPLATLIAMFLGLKLLGIAGFILGPILVIAFTSAKEAGIIKWRIKI